MIKTLLGCFLTLLSVAACAQGSNHRAEKWGKVSPEDLKMTVYPDDSAAAAVVLQDVGSITVKNNDSYWFVEFGRHRRIKVLDVSALDKGNLIIPYWNGELRDLDVQVFLPNGDRQKVKSDNIFKERLDEDISATKIFIPNLQKGCIIEYRYLLKEDFGYRLHPWFFQEGLPVRWSELKLSVPTFFDFIYMLHSPHNFDLEEHSRREEMGYSTTLYTSNITTFGLSNLPAIKEEPQITTLDDYRAHIGFQLKTYYYGDGTKLDFMTTWPDLADKLEDGESFGEHFGDQYLKPDNFKTLWTAFNQQIKPSDKLEEIVEKALRFVNDKMKWNGEYFARTSDKLDLVFEKKTGNSADLNLMVVALLRKAGLKAFPMLVSTRGHGRPYPQYPFKNQFNSVITYIKINETVHLIDAINPFLPAGELNPPHYNGKGWVVDREKSEWVEIKAPESGETWNGKLSLSESGEMTGRFEILVSGPAATFWRAGLDEQSVQEFLKKHFAVSYPEIAMDSISVMNLTDLTKPLSIKFNCKIQGAATIANDFIYVQPVLDFTITENPYKSLNRIYPVNFTFPFKGQYVLNFQAPPGYKIEEIPAAAKVSLPNEGGRLMFSCTRQSEQNMQLVLKMNLSQLEFLPAEYSGLRQFYEIIAEKTKTQLVLKKS